MLLIVPTLISLAYDACVKNADKALSCLAGKFNNFLIDSVNLFIEGKAS